MYTSELFIYFFWMIINKHWVQNNFINSFQIEFKWIIQLYEQKSIFLIKSLHLLHLFNFIYTSIKREYLPLRDEFGLQDKLIRTKAAVHSFIWSSLKSSWELLVLRFRDLRSKILLITTLIQTNNTSYQQSHSWIVTEKKLLLYIILFYIVFYIVNYSINRWINRVANFHKIT